MRVRLLAAMLALAACGPAVENDASAQGRAETRQPNASGQTQAFAGQTRALYVQTDGGQGKILKLVPKR